MKSRIIALRLSRRAIAAAMLKEEQLEFRDGRHLNSRRERAERSAGSYVERLVQQLAPTGVVIYAPSTDDGLRSQVLRTVQTVLVRAGVSLRIVSRREMTEAFGSPPVRGWSEIRAATESFWPELTRLTSAVRPYVTEAAAVALYAESFLALASAPPPS